MSRSKILASLVLLACTATVTSRPVASAVVFNNTTTYQNLENVLLLAGQANSGEHGNQVQLAGTERYVTEIRPHLRIAGAGVAQFDYRVRFYRNDGPDGRPGTLLWESPILHRVIDSGAPLPYPTPVPSVLVPDIFTWTIQIMNRQGNSARMGPSLYNPPTVGHASFGYWAHLGDDWQLGGAAEPPFGARILAEAAATAIEEDAPPALADHLSVTPNPVSSVAHFQFTGRTIAGNTPGSRTLEIISPAGRLVAALPLDSSAVTWSPGPDAPRGVYLARIRGSGSTAGSIKFTVLR